MDVFFKIKGSFFSSQSILSVRRTTPSKGKDGVNRNIVIQLVQNAVGKPTKPEHCAVWCSEEEAEDLMNFLERNAVGGIGTKGA